MRLLTASRLKCARACQRKHRLRYELGYRPVEEAWALRFGTLSHHGLEAWWESFMVRGPDPLAAAFAAMSGEADPFDRVKAEELLRGYHLRWKDEPYDVLAVEAEFETPLRNPQTGRPSQTWRLAGKIDVVLRDRRDGLVRTMEHKTSSEDISAGSIYWRRLRMDGQVSVYYEGAASLGFDVAGCVYDVLYKPQLRPLKKNSKRENDETPEEFRTRINMAIAEEPARYYQRGEVVRLESEMEEALYDIWQVGQQIREAEVARQAPRNPDACMHFGRACEFLGVCSGEASLEDERLFRQSDVVHPELSAAPGAAHDDSNQANARGDGAHPSAPANSGLGHDG